jgi:hypothetical protein
MCILLGFIYQNIITMHGPMNIFGVKRQRMRRLAIFGHKREHITKINTIKLGYDV